jgi:hypothetical protein
MSTSTWLIANPHINTPVGPETFKSNAKNMHFFALPPEHTDMTATHKGNKKF